MNVMVQMIIGGFESVEIEHENYFFDTFQF